MAEATLKQGHFAPCMVGALEAEFLKMMTFGLQAKNVLDVGTFTGKIQGLRSLKACAQRSVLNACAQRVRSILILIFKFRNECCGLC